MPNKSPLKYEAASRRVSSPEVNLETGQSQSITNHEGTESFKFLRSLPQFSEIPTGALQSLAQESRLASVPSRKFLSTEGEEESSYGFIVVSGVIAMSKTSVNGKELIVELLQSTDLFGLLVTHVGDRLPAPLSARSISASKVLWVPINKFSNLLHAHGFLFEELLAHALVCLQSSYCLSRGLAHDRVEARIAAILVSLSIKMKGALASDGVYTVYFTRQQIADLTGTTPETAIRVTRAMQSEGYIDVSTPGVIRVLNLTALEECADL